MTPERWQQVKALLAQALEREPEGRGAFLGSLRDVDPSVIQEVRSLLAYATAAGEAPFDLAAWSEVEDEPIKGRMVGPYRIVDRLGEGGMGEVFKAEELTPIRRAVALKVIQPKKVSAEALARFEAERQMLGRMSHSAVLKLLNAGETEQGSPYLVTELVEGEPITGYCDRNRLPLDARLELFQQVCLGVQHAHQKGVLHRDLKPTNVLVTEQDGRPLPKLIDFGIAKPIEPATLPGHTVTGHVVGTFEYMSPEQRAGADVDTRTDVYALGLLLAQLLIGEFPTRDLESHEPLRPSLQLGRARSCTAEVAELRATDAGGLLQRLRGDLDWIVLKALAPDREHRYAGAGELAGDIARHLTHEPVQAGPPSRGYRMKKFIRRHRAAVIAASLVLAALVAGGGVAIFGLIQARRGERIARQEAETARRVSSFLVGLFEAAKPENAKGRSLTAQEVVERGAATVTSGLQGEPRIQGALLDTLGQVFHALGLYDRAQPLLEQAIEQRVAAFGERSLEVAQSLDHLAEVHRAMGRYPQAKKLQLRALALREELLGRDHSDVAESLHKLALLAYNQGQLADAVPLLERAAAIWEREGPLAAAYALANLALVYRDQARFEEAVPLFEKVKAVFEKELGPDHPDSNANQNNLAELYRTQGRTGKARRLYEQILDTNERVVGPEHPFVAAGLNNLALVYSLEGRYAEAERLYRRVLILDEKSKGREHPDYATTLVNLGVLHHRQGRDAEAEPLLRQGLAIREKALGTGHPNVAGSLYFLAWVVAERGRADEAERLLLRCLTVWEEALGPDHPSVAGALTRLGDVHRKQGRSAEAEPLLQRALAIWDARSTTQPRDLAVTLEIYAAALADLGRSAEASKLADRAKEAREEERRRSLE